LRDDELIVTRQELEQLRDQLFVVERAVDDVERDLGRPQGADDSARLLSWLLEALRPLLGAGDDRRRPPRQRR